MPPFQVPKRGDIIWLNFDPQSGREQAGRRPALVLSPEAYNKKAGLIVACPVTSKVKGYPFEVTIPPGRKISGVVLADQVRSLDWRRRQAELIDEAPQELMEEVFAKLDALLTGG